MEVSEDVTVRLWLVFWGQRDGNMQFVLLGMYIIGRLRFLVQNLFC